jgi:hypothetical protein
MKLLLCVAIALFAGAALATENSEYPDAVVDGVEVLIEESAWESASPETDLMEVDIEASFDEAKASVAQLLQAGKTDAACRNLAKTTAVEVNDSVAASQKAVANMPNGDQCNNEGQDLVKKAKDDKTKADKAEKAALDAVNAAKGAKINFGDYVVSSLKEGDCNPFYTSTVWKNAQKKIKDAEAVYTTKKAEAAAAAKAVTAAEEEARKLVKKCKCESKTAIEKAIKDINSKAKDANQKAWTKSYHMICVLDAKPANNCPVPALPEVKPVPFGQGVQFSCHNNPDYCHTGYEAYLKAGHKKPTVKAIWDSTNVKTGGFTNTAKRFELVRLTGAHGFDQSKAQMDRYVNMCLQAGYQAVGCGSSKNWDSSVCSQSIAMPNGWGCNMLAHIGNKFGNTQVIALQEKIGNNAGLYSNKGQPIPSRTYGVVCGRQI